MNNRSWYYIALACAGYSVFFLGFYPILHENVAIFAFIPPMIFAWWYGIKWGVISAAIIELIMLILLQFEGINVWDINYLLLRSPGFAAIFIIAVITGHMQSLREQIKKELEERRKIETELRISEGLLKGIYSAAPVGIMVEKDRIVQKVNEQFCKISGYSAEELVGKSARQLFSDDAEYDRVRKRYFAQNDYGEIESQWRNKNGELVDILVNTANLDASDHSAGRVVTVLDITERKKYQVQLENKNKEILELTDMVTHDLKKPLTTIKLVCDMMSHSEISNATKETRELLMFGKQSIDYMSVMLEDLLTVSRLDAGKKVITCEAIDLKEMVDSVLERLKLQASQKRIAIANNCTGFISADKKNIEKLFMNCIGNAINYIGGNPDPRIFIGSRFLSDSRMYECIINDNGTGISADIQEEIFQKFKRGKNVSGIQGTGLGLAIAKSVVEMHGGKIWLKSKEGEGTTLYFTLPEDTNPR